MIKVAIGSENPVKIQAVKNAFLSLWPKKKFRFVQVKVKSIVSSQPMSDAESVRGASYRASQALKQTQADYGIGLEAGLSQVNNDYFTRGWIVVVDKKGNKGIASSLSAPVPKKILNEIKQGKELAEVIDGISGITNIKQKQGYFGYLTDNLITRKQAYTEGVIIALARFKKPRQKGFGATR